jgi:hypothetical protein
VCTHEFVVSKGVVHWPAVDAAFERTVRASCASLGLSSLVPHAPTHAHTLSHARTHARTLTSARAHMGLPGAGWLVAQVAAIEGRAICQVRLRALHARVRPGVCARTLAFVHARARMRIAVCSSASPTRRTLSRSRALLSAKYVLAPTALYRYPPKTLTA